MLHIYSVLKLRKGSMVLKPVRSSKRQAVSTSHRKSLQSKKTIGRKQEKKQNVIQREKPNPDRSSTLAKMREPYEKKTPSHEHRRSQLLHALHQIAALRRESGTDATDQVTPPPQVEKEVGAATRIGSEKTSCPPDEQTLTETASLAENKSSDLDTLPPIAQERPQHNPSHVPEPARLMITPVDDAVPDFRSSAGHTLYKQLTPLTAPRVLAVATICDFLSAPIVLPAPIIYVNSSNTLIELIKSEVLPVKQNDRLVVSAKCWVNGLIHHTLEYGAGTDPYQRQGDIHIVRSPIPFTFCTTITFPSGHEPMVHPADHPFYSIISTSESTSRNPIICQLVAFTTDEVITWHSKEEHLRQSSHQSIVQLSLSIQLKLDLVQCQKLMLCIQTGQIFRKMGHMNEGNRIVKNDRAK